MKERDTRRDGPEPLLAPAAPSPAPPAPVAQLLALQRSAGNQAVARALLARNDTATVAEEPQEEQQAEAIIAAARDRIGKMSWGKLAIDKALTAANEAGDTDDVLTSVNCWDAVLVLAYRAGQISLEDLRQVYALSDRDRAEAFISGRQNEEFERMKAEGLAETGSRPELNMITAASVIANRAVREYLVGTGPRRIANPLAPDQLAPGEVVLIEEELGDLSHVALATGTNTVVHLWTLNLTGSGGLEEVTLPELVRGYVEQKLPAAMGQEGNKLDDAYRTDYRATEFGFLKAVQTRVTTGGNDATARHGLQSLRGAIDLERVFKTFAAAAGTEAYAALRTIWDDAGLTEPDALLAALKTEIDRLLPIARDAPATADVVAPYLGTLKVSAATPDWDAARERAQADTDRPPQQGPAAAAGGLQPKEERHWLKRALYAATKRLPVGVRATLKQKLFGR